MANILSSTNPYNFTLLVSTNYINYNGFQSGVVGPTNVNYDYYAAGGALNDSNEKKTSFELQSPLTPPIVPSDGNFTVPAGFPSKSKYFSSDVALRIY